MGGTLSLKFNSLKQLQSLMVGYDLSNIWRAWNPWNPTFRQFTWRQTNPVKLRRLNFSLISNSLQFDVRSCKFLSPIQSDHSPVVLSSCTKSDLRGRGYRKFTYWRPAICWIITRWDQNCEFQFLRWTRSSSHYIFIISQLWLTSHPRSTVVIQGLRVRASPSASSLLISLLVPGVSVSSRTTVLLGWEVNHSWEMINI